MEKKATTTAKERVEQEQFDLLEKVQKLMAFLYSDKGRKLDEESASLLRGQLETMIDYMDILQARLLKWKD